MPFDAIYRPRRLVRAHPRRWPREAGPLPVPIGSTIADPDEPCEIYGQAALILVESLLHTLVETAMLTDREAVDAVQTALLIRTQIAKQTGESKHRVRQVLDLLGKIGSSLATDIG